MDLRPFAARFRLGALSSEAIKDLAGSMLDTDQVTPTWVEIATLSEPIMSTVGPLFERGLREAGIATPSAVDAAWQATRYHMRRIATRGVGPREGAGRLIAEVCHGAHLEETDREFVGDSLGLSELIGNYHAYDDIEARPTEVSCDGRYGRQAKRALGEHIVKNAQDWLTRYGG